jgi:hypothetical protein
MKYVINIWEIIWTKKLIPNKSLLESLDNRCFLHLCIVQRLKYITLYLINDITSRDADTKH